MTRMLLHREYLYSDTDNRGAYENAKYLHRGVLADLVKDDPSCDETAEQHEGLEDREHVDAVVVPHRDVQNAYES